MSPFRKMRPIGEWIWHQIPDQDRLRVEAKLFGEKHTIPLGQYDGHIEVISGELRGRIQHREQHWPQLAEDGLFIQLPESVITSYKNRIQRRERPKISDIFKVEGIPELAILEISEVDDLTWFMFERKETIMRAA